MSGPAHRHFDSSSAAERYVLGRPYLHPHVAKRILQWTGAARFTSVLDVGCGTGQSARAMADIADEVAGLDLSLEMLRRASHNERILLAAGRAEQLPFADGRFDLVTAGLAFHWFDREVFLGEARRVLRPGGWITLYNIAFPGRLTGQPEFTTWSRDRYLERYPSPPRRGAPLEEEALRKCGFERARREQFYAPTLMTAEQLVSFLMSQSNITAALDGRESVEAGEQQGEAAPAIRSWLAAEVSPYFQSGSQSAEFVFELDLLRRTAVPQETRTRICELL